MDPIVTSACITLALTTYVVIYRYTKHTVLDISPCVCVVII